MDWSFIDKVVYINLDRCPERNKKMKEILKPFGDKVLRFNAINIPGKGWLGCSKSHVGVLEMAIENKWKNVLVLEDDIEWNRNEISYKNLQNILNTNWDVILFGGSWSRFDTNSYKLISSHATSSYLVNSNYFETLLHNFKEGCALLENEYGYKFTIDRHWQPLIEKDNWFLIVPNIFYQGQGFSCIDNKNVDYTDCFITKQNIIESPIHVSWKNLNLTNEFCSLEKNRWYTFEHTLFKKEPLSNKITFLLYTTSKGKRSILREGSYFLIKDGNSS